LVKNVVDYLNCLPVKERYDKKICIEDNITSADHILENNKMLIIIDNLNIFKSMKVKMDDVYYMHTLSTLLKIRGAFHYRPYIVYNDSNWCNTVEEIYNLSDYIITDRYNTFINHKRSIRLNEWIK